MIQLASGHCLILQNNGRQSAFSFQELRKLLFECSRRCGINDEWTIENISLIIEEQLLLCSQQNKPLAESEVDRMISSALTAAGFTDVAAEYQRRKNLKVPDLLCVNQMPWDHNRVLSVLEQALPLQKTEAVALTEKVTSAFRQLGFIKVTNEMIQQMAQHCLLQESAAEPAKRKETVSWLFLPEYWQSKLKPEENHAVETKIITICPIARVLPTPRIKLDLARLAIERQIQPFLEMAFLPVLREYSKMLPNLFNMVSREIPTVLFEQEQKPHLLVTGFKLLVINGLASTSRRKTEEFRQFIYSIMENDVMLQLNGNLLVTIR